MKSLTPEAGFIFRITHIDNVRWILRYGIQSKNSLISDPNFVGIGNEELIQRRTHRAVPVAPGGSLSDYVPFYFTPFSPMLYNIKTGYGVRQRSNDEIVILVAKLPSLFAAGKQFLFTDRHAYLLTAQFYNDLNFLSALPWSDIQSRDFSRDSERPDKMERYQAEALIYGSVQPQDLVGIATHSDASAARVQTEIDAAISPIKVISKPGWYFR